MAEFLNSIMPNVVARSGQFWQAFGETLQMVGIVGVLAILIGIPFGVLLFATKPGGILENRPIHFVLNKICDIFRSIPFILLAVILFGLSRLVVGTAIGVKGAIIPLTFATVPFLGRQIEGALSEVPGGLVEAAQSMGCSPWEIITRVYLKEAIPSIARGVTITLISLINFTAIAGAVGAGGLGSFAISYGHSRGYYDIMWTVLVIIIVMVSIVQTVGNLVVRKTTH